MTHLISGPRIKSYRAHQDGQRIDRRHARKWFSHVLTLFLALAVIAVVSQAQEFPLRSEASRRISSLEKLGRQRGVNDPVFKKKVERAQIDFGVSSSLLQPRRISRPQRLNSEVPFSSRLGQWSGFSSDQGSQSAHIQETQTRLSELGHLDAKVDVDGKIGPRTRRALSKFQRDNGRPITGRLDSATETALGLNPLHGTLETSEGDGAIGRVHASRSNVSIDVPAWLVLEDLKSNLSAKYRLLDASGDVLYRGDDQGELATKLNEALSDETRRSIYVEMKGFSEDKAEALASSLRIQQHQIDPAVSIGVLPHIDENLAPHQNLFTRGIMLERGTVSVERIDSGEDTGKFKAELPFSVRVGQEARAVTVRIGAGLGELLPVVLDLVVNLLPPVLNCNSGLRCGAVSF